MTKVITYGTFDVLHHGHIRLLERAKALGDYLIVGITSDDYDRARGKINNSQTLFERVEAVVNTGLVDEVVIEEYEGQKINDICNKGVDVFAIGSDWKGKFDYLNNYCKVVYLERTEGVSSSQLRAEKRSVVIKCDDAQRVEKKFISELKYVNGIQLAKDGYNARYVVDRPEEHYSVVKRLLEQRINVLCESPICLNPDECKELFQLAKRNGCFLFDGLKTAYSTAFSRMLLLIKSGIIGDIVSIDSVCTSMADFEASDEIGDKWNSICYWGPTALLPVFLILGTKYVKKEIATKWLDKKRKFDAFSEMHFIYPNAVASVKVAQKAKSEGELIISGTKGYIYVPSPWWKTDYFEVRFENPHNNKRYFYQLNGEGIRNEIAMFVKSISGKKNYSNVSEDISIEITRILKDFYDGKSFEI